MGNNSSKTRGRPPSQSYEYTLSPVTVRRVASTSQVDLRNKQYVAPVPVIEQRPTYADPHNRVLPSDPLTYNPKPSHELTQSRVSSLDNLANGSIVNLHQINGPVPNGQIIANTRTVPHQPELFVYADGQTGLNGDQILQQAIVLPSPKGNEPAPSVISRTSSHRSQTRPTRGVPLPPVGKVKDYYQKHGFPIRRFEVGRVSKRRSGKALKSGQPVMISRAASMMSLQPGSNVVYRPLFRRKMEPVGFLAEARPNVVATSRVIAQQPQHTQPQFTTVAAPTRLVPATSTSMPVGAPIQQQPAQVYYGQSISNLNQQPVPVVHSSKERNYTSTTPFQGYVSESHQTRSPSTRNEDTQTPGANVIDPRRDRQGIIEQAALIRNKENKRHVSKSHSPPIAPPAPPPAPITNEHTASPAPKLKITRHHNSLSPRPLFEEKPDTFRKFKSELVDEFRRRANRREITREKLIRKESQLVEKRSSITDISSQDYDYKIAKEFAFLNREADYTAEQWNQEANEVRETGSVDSGVGIAHRYANNSNRYANSKELHSNSRLSDSSLDSGLRVTTTKSRNALNSPPIMNGRAIRNERPISNSPKRYNGARSNPDKLFYVVRRRDRAKLELVDSEELMHLQREGRVTESELAPNLLVEMMHSKYAGKIKYKGASLVKDMNGVRLSSSRLMEDFLKQEHPDKANFNDSRLTNGHGGAGAGRHHASYTIVDGGDQLYGRNVSSAEQKIRRSKKRETQLQRLRSDLQDHHIRNGDLVNGGVGDMYDYDRFYHQPPAAAASSKIIKSPPASRVHMVQQDEAKRYTGSGVALSGGQNIRKYDDGVLVRVGFDDDQNWSFGGGHKGNRRNETPRRAGASIDIRNEITTRY